MSRCTLPAVTADSAELTLLAAIRHFDGFESLTVFVIASNPQVEMTLVDRRRGRQEMQLPALTHIIPQFSKSATTILGRWKVGTAHSNDLSGRNGSAI